MPPSPRLCRLDVRQPAADIITGQLRLGGADAQGNRLEVNSRYLAWNGRPLMIISGELHYSRCPAADWEEALLKLKAGGLNTVATYIFWSFHEARPGEFDWQGPKDLRRFVALCARHGLKVILRIGPFAHGEWRNGGLPDWLYGQPFEVRSNDPAYLERVAGLYGEIARQVEGLLFAEGGPIVGIQLENEYMHAGAPWEVVPPERPSEWVPAGHDGVAHLRTLKDLAQQAGLNVPIYLVTAWGAPYLPLETLPVYGGYAYPVWVDEPAPSVLYTFQDGPAEPPKDPLYPLLFAEMQGGIQVRYGNRPRVPARAVEASALVCLGRGSNWLGYYMYHGGTTPPGPHGFSNERLHPQLSYDFQAPLGEYGEYHASYHALRLLHLFMQAYAETLAPMDTRLPAEAGEITPEDSTHLRWCARASDAGGFLFVNNFQDHAQLPDQPEVVFELDSAHGPLRLPRQGSLSVAAGACFILPFDQVLAGARLLSATVQPLTVLTAAAGAHYFFFAVPGLEPEYCFAASTLRQVEGARVEHTGEALLRLRPRLGLDESVEIETASGQQLRLTTLTRAQAEQVYQGQAWGQPRVVHSPAPVVFVDDQLETRSLGLAEWRMTVWPPLAAQVRAAGAECEQSNTPSRTRLSLSRPAGSPNLTLEPAGPRKTLVRLAGPLPLDASEAFLDIDYEGDTGLAFINGRLVADHFNNGTPWRIGLKRFAGELAASALCLVFSPRRDGVTRNTSSALAGRAEFEGAEVLQVRDISLSVQYRTCFTTE